MLAWLESAATKQEAFGHKVKIIGLRDKSEAYLDFNFIICYLDSLKLFGLVVVGINDYQIVPVPSTG